MAIDEPLTSMLHGMNLGKVSKEPEWLLFNPREKSGLTQNIFDHVPRFLFRIASRYSDGETNETWVHSLLATQKRELSLEDIFARLDLKKQRKVACALNQHLRWWPEKDFDDNFVSWTSSLLFALQYIYYRHASTRDKSTVENIKLYVVDTEMFPKGTFIRDLDLIKSFLAFDTHPINDSLHVVRRWRVQQGFYFGEYLSQGSLKIAGKCQVVSAKELLGKDRLRCLQPAFNELAKENTIEKPPWAHEVNRLRTAIQSDMCSPISTQRIDAVKKAVEVLTDLFEPEWRLPMAIYFWGLTGQVPDTRGPKRTGVAEGFLQFFRRFQLSEEGKHKLPPPAFKLIVEYSMAEMKCVQDIADQVYSDAKIMHGLDRLEEARLIVHQLHGDKVFGEKWDAILAEGPIALTHLNAIQMLCSAIVKDILPCTDSQKF